MNPQIRVRLSGWLSLTLAVALLSFAAAAELPPRVMARQYFIEMENAAKNCNYEEAIKLAEKIIALERNRNKREYSFATAEFYIRYAEILLFTGRIERASKVIVAVLNDPHMPPWEIDATLRMKKRIDELRSYAGLPSDLDIDLPNGVMIKFKKIPAGTFMMGSPNSEKGRHESEVQHEVTISKPFYLGICEVTQAKYEAVMGNNPSNFKGGVRPVEHVAWEDAAEFCRKASDLTGKRFRLPTEAEWEYACRAGTITPFNFGDDISPEQANYNGNFTYGWGEKGVYRKETLAVGSFPPNAWGLYDMHGNVLEWCSDWYGDYATEKQTDPQGAARGTCRVLRGGCWNYNPEICRSAYRLRYTPGFRGSSLGFRVALD